MKWEELKNIIIKDISSRALKDPDRRLKSLEKIEIIMQQHYPIYLQNTSNIITTGKESFKKQISEIKGTGLNSAEISIINEIYNKLNPSLQQTKSPLKVRYKVYTCPNCYTMLQITEDLWDQDFLSCPQCGNDFSNPIKEEERLAIIQKGFIVSGMLGDVANIIFWLFILIAVLWCIWSCQSSNKILNNDKFLEYSISNIDSKFQIISLKEQNNDKLIGIWIDDFNTNILWRIRNISNNQYLMEIGSMDSDQWISSTQLSKIKKGKQILYHNNDEGYVEYYQIDDNGNLSVFDNLGYITTYAKLH